VSLDESLGLRGEVRATELVSGEALTGTAGGLSVTAPAKTVIAVAVQAGG
jgi:hypothetical protein